MSSTFSPRLHQRAHERSHERGLGDARGLPLALADGVLDQRPARGVVRGAQKAQLFGHGGHQFAVDPVVPVDLLHEAALGGQLLQYLSLDAAQHQPLAAQMFAQQLRLGHHGGVVAVAPLAGKALPVAQAVKVEDVDNVPDLAALIVDGRAGQADDVFAGLRKQAGGGILARAVAAQFLHLVKDDGAKALLGQDVLPAAQEQIVDDVDVRLGQLVGREAADDVHAQPPVRGQKALKLPLPVANEVRRHHEDGRIGRRGGQKRQRLHGLAQAHLVGQQATAGGEQKGQPLLLKIQQFAGKGAGRRRGRLRAFQHGLAARGVFAGLGKRLLPALAVALGDLQRVAQHQPVEVAHHAAVRGEARHPPPAPVAAGKEALGKLGDAGLGLDRPGAALAVVGERSIDVPVHGRVAQIKRIVHGNATPQRRLSEMQVTRLPRTRAGRGVSFCVTTMISASSSQAR